MTKQRIAILGASGYTGAELLRLLALHPAADIVALTGETQAGKSIEEVYPHLRSLKLPKLVKHGEVDFTKVDMVFCCLPHGTTQEIIAGLPQQVRIVDLSADFRLHDPAAYAEWYGHAHQATELQKEAVFGLTEHAREAVAKARLVANPGCYPTASLLPLIPLLQGKHIDPERIIIDAKSGVTGAGRSLKQNTLFCEANEGIGAYGIPKHRHSAEIEQELSGAAGQAVQVNFTPHLVPMDRGILATIYVKLNTSLEAARKALHAAYDEEYFVQVVEGNPPSTHQVRGSNFCAFGIYPGRREGEAVIVSAIDNLVKGASGQAIQNFNCMLGLEESTGLQQLPLFP